jgi:hypothetical protein
MQRNSTRTLKRQNMEETKDGKIKEIQELEIQE